MHNNIPFLNIIQDILVNQSEPFTSALKILTFFNNRTFSCICRISLKQTLQMDPLLISTIYWWAWPSSYVKKKIIKSLKIYEVINYIFIIKHILTKHTTQKETMHLIFIGPQCHSLNFSVTASQYLQKYCLKLLICVKPETVHHKVMNATSFR